MHVSVRIKNGGHIVRQTRPELDTKGSILLIEERYDTRKGSTQSPQTLEVELTQYVDSSDGRVRIIQWEQASTFGTFSRHTYRLEAKGVRTLVSVVIVFVDGI